MPTHPWVVGRALDREIECYLHAERRRSFEEAAEIRQSAKFRIDRLVAAFDFRRQIAFVKFIGTHAEYDRIDALKVSQF